MAFFQDQSILTIKHKILPHIILKVIWYCTNYIIFRNNHDICKSRFFSVLMFDLIYFVDHNVVVHYKNYNFLKHCNFYWLNSILSLKMESESGSILIIMRKIKVEAIL